MADAGDLVRAAIKPLVWEETFIARGDGQSEHDGGYEAESIFGFYCIGMGEQRWVSRDTDHNMIGDYDDPALAKAAAQADYESRLIATLDLTAIDAALAQARREGIEAAARFLDKERAFYEPIGIHGTLDGIPYSHVAHVLRIFEGRLRALPDASPAPQYPDTDVNPAVIAEMKSKLPDYSGEEWETMASVGKEFGAPPEPVTPALAALANRPGHPNAKIMQMRRDYEAAGDGRTRTVDVAMLKRIREMLVVAVEAADNIISNPAGSLWNYGTVPSALDKAQWKGAVEAAKDVGDFVRPALTELSAVIGDAPQEGE